MKDPITLTLTIAVILTIIPSCVLINLDMEPDISRRDTERQEGQISPGLSPDGTYVTAVSFEEGYDWRRDPSYDQAKGKVIVFKGCRPVLSLDAGRDCEISTDPDRHHLVGGHLYTEYSDSRQTVIKMDGEEVCRYDGCEMIKGMLEDDGSLYVLSQDMDGKGFTLRKDWATVLRNDVGILAGGLDEASYQPHGALYTDNGSICMSYRSYESDGREESWHLITDMTDRKVRIPDGMTTVCDMKSIDGKICLAGLGHDNETPVMSIGEKDIRIEKAVNSGKDLRLYKDDGGDIVMAGSFSLNGLESGYTGICYANGEISYRITDCSCFRGDCWVAVLSGFAISYHSPEGTARIDGDYRLLSCRCVSWNDTGVVLALTPSSVGRKALLWENGKTSGIDINGYLTSVTAAD